MYVCELILIILNQSAEGSEASPEHRFRSLGVMLCLICAFLSLFLVSTHLFSDSIFLRLPLFYFFLFRFILIFDCLRYHYSTCWSFCVGIGGGMPTVALDFFPLRNAVHRLAHPHMFDT